jgi:hypothetical protein
MSVGVAMLMFCGRGALSVSPRVLRGLCILKASPLRGAFHFRANSNHACVVAPDLFLPRRSAQIFDLNESVAKRL